MVADRRPLFSLRLNNDVGATEFVELAVLAEECGFDQIWLSHDLFFRSAPVLLAAAARETKRIALGTCVLNPYSSHPAEIAMTAATLQELTDGRFLLGLAAGAADFLGWAGLRRAAPLRVVAETVCAVRALCSGQPPVAVRGCGPGWQPEARMRIPPQPTPIYVGAMSPRMMELIGEVADGGLPLLYPPESFAAAQAHVLTGLRRSGRSTAAVDLAACIWVSVHDDPALAVRPLAEKLVYYGPAFAPAILAGAGTDAAALAALRALPLDDAVRQLPPAMLDLGIAGPPAEVVTRCRGLLAAGARHLSFGPPLGPNRMAATRLLGTAVLPRLRRAAPV